MTIENIKRAQAEAKRFLTCAAEALTNTYSLTGTDKVERRYMHNGKLSGTLRRASMDLTRALAEMRKP